MAYTPITWTDGENRYDIKTQASAVVSADIKLVYVGSGGTPISATNLNHIDSGIMTLESDLSVVGSYIYDKWIQIATATITSDLSAISFSSIPTNYTKLLLVGGNFASDSTTPDYEIHMRFNSDSGSNYYNAIIVQNVFYNPGGVTNTYFGSAAGSGYETLPKNHSTRSKTAFELNIFQPLSTNYKHIYGQLYDGNPANAVVRMAGVWVNTADKTTDITIFPTAGNFLTSASVTLYGRV